ncbi:MAG: hypothetical protein LKJ75_02415 [Clostridia bacterium]|nr:hypothetical protein [Clostridia bacterium]MCI2014037.1 hypothetical protein [Clostridia bacterium]
MIKEAIEKIEAMAAPTLKEIDGHLFVVTNDGKYSEIFPDVIFPDVLNLNSLDALIKMVKTEGIPKYSDVTPLYITVPTHEKVECFTQPFEHSGHCIRPTYYIAKATDVPGWEPSTQLSFEQAMIALRTRFQDTADTIYALKLLSDITTGAQVTYNDNGLATSVVTKKGIALQSNDAIKPIVKLKPYRTFQEVEQPESEFLIRINERGINFVEADGGMWKLTARKTIKAYLDDKFESEIENNSVVIAL